MPTGFKRGSPFTAALVLASAALSVFGQSGTYLITTIAGRGRPVFTFEGQPATSADLFAPEAVARDASGNVYFTDGTYHQVFRVDPAGIITSLGGTGEPGFAGDGGPAVEAQFNCPDGLALDAAGNLYVADSCNNRIRRIDPAGIVTTVAGNGEAGSGGDGGPAVAAQLLNPIAVALDTASNLYIVDNGNERVRRVAASGVITTVAGNGTAGFSGDHGPATSAMLNNPLAVAVDPRRGVYVGDCGNGRVRLVAPSGEIATIAGTSTRGYSGDGGIPISAELGCPADLAFEEPGNLYILDPMYNVVRRIGSDGKINTVAGNAGIGYSGDGGLATEASLGWPSGVAVGANGQFYISDFLARRILTVDAGIIRTIAGVGPPRSIGDGRPPEEALFLEPLAVALDSAANLYIADGDDSRIRTLAPDGTMTTFAGSGEYGFDGDGGLATLARLNWPRDLDFDVEGNLYVAGSYKVRRVDPAGVISTVAGTGQDAAPGDGGPALQATMGPWLRTAVDPSGDLYISDEENNRIRKVDRSGIINTIAGTGVPGYSGDGGPAVQAQIHDPAGIAVDGSGNLYIADSGNGRVRKVDFAGRITTVAVDLPVPSDVALDSAGNLYITDAEAHTIRKMTPQGVISTIAGTGVPGFDGDGGPATSALLNSPTGLFVAPDGVIYLADTGNQRIRRLEPARIFPTGVGNAASYESGAVAPGELVTIFGIDVGPPDGAGLQLDADGKVMSMIGETRVLVDGVAAPMVSAFGSQVTFVVPYNVGGKQAVEIQVEYQGVLTNKITIPVVACVPGLFTYYSTGSGQAAVLNQDWSTNSPSNPAPRGSIVMLFATGAGETDPPSTDGQVTEGVYPTPKQRVTATVGGIPATVHFAAAAPGTVSGVLQVNVEIPAGVAPGDAVSIVIFVGDRPSQAGVTLAVR